MKSPRIFVGDFPIKYTSKDLAMFDKADSKCVALFTDKHDEPIVVSKVKSAYMPYRVTFGSSCLVFDSYESAVDYCKKRYKEVE